LIWPETLNRIRQSNPHFAYLHAFVTIKRLPLPDGIVANATDGCDLVFLAKSKDGDYHQEMNSVVFLEWFENQSMPALKNHSLVVLDNASYHNVKAEDTVCPKLRHQTHHSEATYNLCSDFG
jgi:hypothetical protein